MIEIKKEIYISRHLAGQFLEIEVATRRAAGAVIKAIDKYCVNETTWHRFKPASEASGRVPTSQIVKVSNCYDVDDVVAEIESIDLYRVEPVAPEASRELLAELIGSDGRGAKNLARWAWNIGRSDESHAIQDDIAFVPYCSHTPQEMVDLFLHLYRDTGRVQLNFIKRCKGSVDPRVKFMNSFAMEIAFEVAKKLDKAPTKQ